MITLFALLFGLQLQAHADATAVVKEVDVNNKVIAIEAKGGATKPGDRWVWESGDESCIFNVYTVRGSIASAKSSECESIKKVKSGQNLKLSLIDTETAAPVPVVQHPKPEKVRGNPDLPTANEDWYILFGGGFSGTSYQGEAKDAIKAIDDMPGSTKHAALSLDLGVYFPMANYKTMLGANIQGTGDVYSNDSNGGEYAITVSQSLLAFSAQHFFGANIGSGWFVRGDIGLAKMALSYKQPLVDTEVTSKSGLGLLLGGGYSIPCGEETRVQFFLTVSSRHFGGDRYAVSTLGADFLF